MPRFRDWLWAVLKTGLGGVLLWFVARMFPKEHPLLRGWTGMLGLILLLHFGTFQIAALFWQSLGVDAPPIMSAPFRAQSLSQFWGKRWNLGFRQLAHDLILVPLHKYLQVGLVAFLVFLISGFIHDLVISVPAGTDYGLPTGYFILQGFGVILERSPFGKQFGLGEGVRGWLFMVLVAAGPVFWLFHPPFVMRVMIPFMKAIYAL
ncbi:MAG: MBOAT family protein [Candidatus Acidiferrum sp.]